MSGPKVVRIVTREEIVAICEGLLSQLREAVRQWEKAGLRSELLDNEAIEKTRQRVKDLENLLARDRFVDLQKQVRDEIAFLKVDMVKRIEEAAKKAADARVRHRRLASMARQKIEDADRSGLELPKSLRRELENVAGGSANQERAEAALAEALTLSLRQAKGQAISPEQRELADKLRGKERSTSLKEWLERFAPPTEETDRKVDAALAELTMLGGGVEASTFAEHQAAIQKVPSVARRRMLSDTLMLEVSKATNAQRENSKLLSALAEQAAQLAALSSSTAGALAERAKSVLALEDAQAAAKLTSEIVEFITRERNAMAAAAKRRAILTTLTELGYEVREGMETAWVRDGKLVMRRAANPSMGVEVKGAAGSEQIQFRPVRFGAEGTKSDRANDRQIETIWCADFDKLRNQVRAEKGDFKIEKAMAVGAVEVLFIAESESLDTRRTSTAPLKSRSL